MLALLGQLFGTSAADAGRTIATPIEAIGNVFDKLFTSDEEKAQAQAVLAKLAQRPGELQVELNKVEAAHRSIFVAGARPFIMWVCGVSLASYYIPQFIMASVMWTIACYAAGKLVPYPITEVAGLMELTIAMLGLGGLRTIDKALGTSK
jgi:hypothetical protein